MSMETPTFHGGPLPFITISPTTGECVVEEYASKILSQINGRIAVIAVAGLFRTGKSFLMNRLIGMQDGFEVGPSVNPCTKGIWIWGQPVQLGQDYYAILIDTEGLGSGNKSSVDAAILTLSVLASSYFIYNSVGAISETCLDQLGVISNVVKAVNSSPFTPPAFLWVLRDFNLRLVNENDQPISARDYLESALRVSSGSTSEKNSIRESIKQLFPERDCITMARPLESEAELRQINKVAFESLRSVFRNQIENFVEKVYTTIEPKRINSSGFLNGQTFCQLMAQYCAVLNANGGHVVSGLNATAWENVVINQLRTSLKEAVGVYRSVLNEDGMKRLPLSDVQLRALHLKAKAMAKAAFPSSSLLASLQVEDAELSLLGTGGGGDPNASVEVTSPSMFLREFRARREQLLEHLKAENLKVSLSEIEKIFLDLVRQIIDSRSSSSPIDAWRTLVAVLEQQCAPKFTALAVSTFVSKQLIPNLISNCSAGSDGRLIQLETQLAERNALIENLTRKSRQDLNSNNREVDTLREMVRQLQERLTLEGSRRNLTAKGDPNISVASEISAIKDLLVRSLTDVKNIESDKRSVEVKAENERSMMELERRFNKQLNEARRKNEMMIEDLRNNYEAEINSLKLQKSELQDMVRETEKNMAIKKAEAEKLALAIDANENDRVLRSNFANVINQQSELVLQFLKNGAKLTPSQFSDLNKLKGQQPSQGG